MNSSFWTLNRILGAVLGVLGFIALLIGTPSRGSQVTLDTADKYAEALRSATA